MRAERGDHVQIGTAENPAAVTTLVDAESAIPAQGRAFNFENSFWFSVYTLFAGEPIPATPQSVWGRIISVFLMFMGMTIFAIFAGTVSAFMVDRLRIEGNVVNLNELDDHVVICGWTAKTETIINEYRATKATKSTPIVVITELESDTLCLLYTSDAADE